MGSSGRRPEPGACPIPAPLRLLLNPKSHSKQNKKAGKPKETICAFARKMEKEEAGGLSVGTSADGNTRVWIAQGKKS